MYAAIESLYYGINQNDCYLKFDESLAYIENSLVEAFYKDKTKLLKDQQAYGKELFKKIKLLNNKTASFTYERKSLNVVSCFLVAIGEDEQVLGEFPIKDEDSKILDFKELNDVIREKLNDYVQRSMLSETATIEEDIKLFKFFKENHSEKSLLAYLYYDLKYGNNIVNRLDMLSKEKGKKISKLKVLIYSTRRPCNICFPRLDSDDLIKLPLQEIKNKKEDCFNPNLEIEVKVAFRHVVDQEIDYNQKANIFFFCPYEDPFLQDWLDFLIKLDSIGNFNDFTYFFSTENNDETCCLNSLKQELPSPRFEALKNEVNSQASLNTISNSQKGDGSSFEDFSYRKVIDYLEQNDWRTINIEAKEKFYISLRLQEEFFTSVSSLSYSEARKKVISNESVVFIDKNKWNAIMIFSDDSKKKLSAISLSPDILYKNDLPNMKVIKVSSKLIIDGTIINTKDHMSNPIDKLTYQILTYLEFLTNNAEHYEYDLKLIRTEIENLFRREIEKVLICCYESSSEIKEKMKKYVYDAHNDPNPGTFPQLEFINDTIRLTNADNKLFEFEDNFIIARAFLLNFRFSSTNKHYEAMAKEFTFTKYEEKCKVIVTGGSDFKVILISYN